MEISYLQNILDIFSNILMLVIPFSLVMCLTQLVVGFFGDFVLGRFNSRVNFK